MFMKKGREDSVFDVSLLLPFGSRGRENSSTKKSRIKQQLYLSICEAFYKFIE